MLRLENSSNKYLKLIKTVLVSIAFVAHSKHSGFVEPTPRTTLSRWIWSVNCSTNKVYHVRHVLPPSKHIRCLHKQLSRINRWRSHSNGWNHGSSRIRFQTANRRRCASNWLDTWVQGRNFCCWHNLGVEPEHNIQSNTSATGSNRNLDSKLRRTTERWPCSSTLATTRPYFHFEDSSDRHIEYNGLIGGTMLARRRPKRTWLRNMLWLLWSFSKRVSFGLSIFVRRYRRYRRRYTSSEWW